MKGGWLWANIYSFFLLVGCLLCSRWSRGSRVPRAPTWVLRCRIPGPRYSGEATLRATWRLESINLCPSLPHPSCVLSSRSSHVVAWLFTRAPSPRSRMRPDMNIVLAQRSPLRGRMPAAWDLARVGLRWWGGSVRLAVRAAVILPSPRPCYRGCCAERSHFRCVPLLHILCDGG